MKFSFFVPKTKVHKQRNLMRETDSRLAKYSIRGMALSVLVFGVSMLLGDFYHQQPLLTCAFASGIILATVFRAYYLIRFDVIYARAPEYWRNVYFTITVFGAILWGLMLASVTYVVGMDKETPLLWLYTIAFFSSCSHVFSPYQRFYTIYMSVSLLPSSLIAILSLNALDGVYGLIMLVLFFLMRTQGVGQGNAYWDRLQANYDLTQRANALQAEKISSESSLSNKDTLFTNLAGELKTSLREIMGSLQLLKLSTLQEQDEQLVSLTVQKSQQQMHMLQNILEFSHISRKEIRLEGHVMDLRGAIDRSVTSVSDRLYKKQIEVFSQFSSAFPFRVRGDSERIEQILVNMIVSAIDYSGKGALLLDVSYTEGVNGAGTLKVMIDIDNPFRNIEIEQQLHDAFKPHYASNMSQGLSLAIAKGLAVCMQGDAGANYSADGHLKFWFTIVLPIVTPANNGTQSLPKLNGKSLLLFQPPKIIENEYQDNLESWGFNVDIIYEYDNAISKIEESKNSSKPYDLVLIYTSIGDFIGFDFAKHVSEVTNNTTRQLLCITDTQSKLKDVVAFVEDQALVEIIRKPIQYKSLRQRLKHMLTDDDDSLLSAFKGGFLKDKNILLYQIEEIDQTIAEVMLKKLGCIVTIVKSAEAITEQAEVKAFDAFITESQITGIDTGMKIYLESIKSTNQKLHQNGYVLPVLGLNQHEQEGEETKCLQSGMDYYIDLPLQFDDLKAILRRWIGRAIHLAESQ
jgi:signal transduction histidine kinase/DNA-binding response OmpR family regulator